MVVSLAGAKSRLACNLPKQHLAQSLSKTGGARLKRFLRMIRHFSDDE